MKPLHYLLLILCLLVCQTAFAQNKRKKKNQDSVQIQPFPISDIILLPKPEGTAQDDDYSTDMPDPLLRTDSIRQITPEEEKDLRVGAICADGTQSTATGRGACAGHGGVKQWIYKDQPKPNLPQINYKNKKGDNPQQTDQSPQTGAPREIYTSVPHPVTSVAEIFGQIAIVILIFLLLFFVIKKVVEKL